MKEATLIRDKINLLRESVQTSEAIHSDAAALLASMAAIDKAVQPGEVRSRPAAGSSFIVPSLPSPLASASCAVQQLLGLRAAGAGQDVQRVQRPVEHQGLRAVEAHRSLAAWLDLVREVCLY